MQAYLYERRRKKRVNYQNKICKPGGNAKRERDSFFQGEKEFINIFVGGLVCISFVRVEIVG